MPPEFGQNTGGIWCMLGGAGDGDWCLTSAVDGTAGGMGAFRWWI